MHALRFHTHGDPATTLQLDEIEERPLEDGEVRLKILAAPVNPADLNLIQGNYGTHPALPATVGMEGCGEVTGSRSADFRIGDRVIALRPVGSWAQSAVTRPENLFKLPPGLDPHQASMLKVNPATAWRLLTSFATLQPGDWIVQNAANSAVGRCVIALAKRLGIRTINLVRREELIEELKNLGGDEVLLDDDSAVERAASLKPRLAFNCVGGESSVRLLKALAPAGIHVTYGAMARRPVTVSARALIFDGIQVRGLWITRWIEEGDPAEVAEVYRRLAALMLDGVISIPVDAVYGLADYAAALARLEGADRVGKVLFAP